jgi:cystathionine beta-synthase
MKRKSSIKEEIYPYRMKRLGKRLDPSATDFDVIDKFTKVKDEDAHMARKDFSS